MGSLYLNNVLSSIYYNIKNPASFKNSIKLYLEAKKKLPNIKFKHVKSWLNKQESYTLFRPIRKFKRNYMISNKVDYNWQADLVEIPFTEHNNGFKFILMIIDVLSKYGFVYLLNNKKPLSIKTGLNSIILKNKRKPKILTTDAGTEFNNIIVKKILKYKKIHHFITRNTEVKAAVVERWNRTIKEIIFKYLHHYNTKRFIDVLQDIVDNYNNTVHSRTKFKPIDVNKNNEFIVYNNLYNVSTIQQKVKFKIGDIVRIKRIKTTFEKGYLPNWTKEIFTIKKILNTTPYVRYIIQDIKKEEIIGSFYEKELLLIDG